MILVPRHRPVPRARRIGRLALMLALTLVAHGAMLGLLVLSSFVNWSGTDRERALRPPPARPVELRGLTAEQFEANRGREAPRVKDSRTVIAKKPKVEEKKKPEEMPKGQVVDVAPGNQKVDPNAKYLAATNNAVDKQTRAREQTAFYKNAMPQRTARERVDGNGTDDATQAQRAGNEGLGDDDRPLREAEPKFTMQVPDVKKSEEVALKGITTEGPGVSVANRSEVEAMKGNSDRFNVVPGARDRGEDVSAGRIGKAGILNLLPSAAVLDKITGAAANDHLKDVDEGDGTFLSTREWRYASFFNRVKQSVGQNWDPNTQMRLRDPTGQIYGGRDRYTMLSVTLDQAGRLKDAFVEKSSGLDFLDLEAIKAFERAQPFPNPPPGLLADDSTVRFQFGFFLELSGRPGMRLFRSTQ